MTDYRPAPEPEAIARDLIRDVEQHKALDSVRVDYVYRDTAAKNKGKTVLAKARKVSGLNAFLANAEMVQRDFFVVEFAEDVWDDLDEHQQRALVDHELCHLYVEFDAAGTPQLSLRAHDLEEFAAVVQRHGLWLSSTAQFGSAVAEQLAMAVDEVSRFVEGLGDDE